MPGWAHIALRDAQGPLILEGRSGGAGGQRAVITLFDLSQSDLALGVDFPVLISNLLDWLAPTGLIDTAVVHPGALLNVSLPDDQTRVSVSGPDGSTHYLVPVTDDQGSLGASFSATDMPGAYTLRVASGEGAHVARFVVDPVLQPVNPEIGSTKGKGPSGTAGLSGTTKIPSSLTSAAALLVLGVLAAEWFVAMRVQ